MSGPRKFRCSVVYDLQLKKSFSGAPTTPSQRLEFTLGDAETLIRNGLWRGLEVKAEHINLALPLGHVTNAMITKTSDGRKSLVMDFELSKETIDDNSWSRLIRSGQYSGVSLSHFAEPGVTPSELSICLQGARPETGIIQQFDDASNKWEPFSPTQQTMARTKAGDHNVVPGGLSQSTGATNVVVSASSTTQFSMDPALQQQPQQQQQQQQPPQQQQQQQQKKQDDNQMDTSADVAAVAVPPADVKTPEDLLDWKRANGQPLTAEETKMLSEQFMALLGAKDALTKRVSAQGVELEKSKHARADLKRRNKEANRRWAQVVSGFVDKTNNLSPAVMASFSDAFNDDSQVDAISALVKQPWMQGIVNASLSIQNAMQQPARQQQQQQPYQSSPQQDAMFASFKQARANMKQVTSSVSSSSSSGLVQASAAAQPVQQPKQASDWLVQASAITQQQNQQRASAMDRDIAATRAMMKKAADDFTPGRNGQAGTEINNMAIYGAWSLPKRT